MLTLIGAAALAALAACTTGKSGDTRAAGDTGAPAMGADAAGAAHDSGMGGMGAAAHDTATAPGTGAANDPDRAAGGSGVPAGYVGHTDRDNAKITDAKYTVTGNRWEVTTGPAHILYAAKDAARGNYTATATFEQLEAPRHPEAFGMFVGGQNLDQPGQRYTYFLVRGGGEFLVKVRDGTQTRDVIGWRASPAVPKADASGKGSYRLAVRVGTDSVRFLVNDKEAGAVARSAVVTDGVAGLRINHNLHVATQPVTITK